MPQPRVSWQMLPAVLLFGVIALLSAPPGTSEAAGFPVSVGTSTITGQEGKVLLFFAEPAGGGDQKVACAPINSEIFDPGALVLKEPPQGDPCAGGTPDAFILPGMTTIRAGVYVGGSQTPEKQVTATVDVQDESTWILDGVALTADTTGDSDCDREADAVDALHVLRNVAGIGLPAVCLAAGNLKCDDGITAVDALFILRHVAQLPLNLPQGCPSPLAAPVLVSPEDGAVVHTDVQRLVDLEWEPVPSALGYGVQVDCMHCCVVGQFCADVGRDYSLAVPVGDTSYTVPDLTGDNLFRWRVWVINEDGTPGDFSDWRTFVVDSSPVLH